MEDRGPTWPSTNLCQDEIDSAYTLAAKVNAKVNASSFLATTAGGQIIKYDIDHDPLQKSEIECHEEYVFKAVDVIDTARVLTVTKHDPIKVWVPKVDNIATRFEFHTFNMLVVFLGNSK